MIRKRIQNQKFRITRQVNIHSGDLQRWCKWHIGGGKSFYNEHYRQIIAVHDWVFIVGCNNSGTTLLQKVLQRSGQVSTMRYEGQRHSTMFPRAYKFGYDRVWSEYAQELVLPPSDPHQIMPRLIHDWYTSLPQPVHTMIVEKTPANVLRMEFIDRQFPKAYFIGLVRNGYAVSEGIKRISGHSVARAARHWRRVSEMLNQNSQKVENYLEIRYEDLTENLEACVINLANFLGIDADALSGVQNETFYLNTVSGRGNQSIKNFNQKSIKRLSRVEIDDIFEHAGTMLEYYGYTPDLNKEKQ